MLYVSEPDGHKFSVGEKLRLVDLETVPEYNGDIVEIVAIRADDYYGKTYYVEGSINEVFDWVYEYRLERIS